MDDYLKYNYTKILTPKWSSQPNKLDLVLGFRSRGGKNN